MKFLLLNLFVCAFVYSAYSQDTIHIPNDYSTIQAGINAATDGDIVLVQDGTYLENINFRGKAIKVASHFLIDSLPSHIENTIIDGSQPSHPDSGSVVTFNSGEDTNSVLCGFTITGGTGTRFQISIPIPPYALILRNGAGILILNSGAIVVNNRIIQNNIDDSQVDECAGGGIAIGSLGIIRWTIIKNNLIQSNSSSNGSIRNSGGGLSIFSNAIVCDNIIRYNLAYSNTQTTIGGGLHFESGDSIIVTNNFIYGNESITNSTSKLGVGGGMYFMRKDSAYVLVMGNELVLNEVKSSYWSGGSGVGFDNVNGEILFANNIIRDNYYSGLGESHGGGIYVTNAEVRIINNTFSGNEATYGGGVCNRYSEGTVYINNIFWNDDSYAGHKEIEIIKDSGEPDPEIIYNDIQDGWSGEGNIDSDPLFVVGDTLFNLSDLSLCIGAGIDSIEINGFWYYVSPFDFDGDPRPNPPGSLPDMGAQESPLGEPATTISIYPTELNFGEVEIDSSETMTFTITNTGSADLEVTNISSSETAFTVNIDTTTISPGGDQDFAVTFTPTDSSQYSGIIEITSNAVGNPHYVTVMGNGIPSGIEDELLSTIPSDFVVYQNFPNPFNPTTSIKYSIPKESGVRLEIMNVLGEQVELLVNETNTAGDYEAIWDASNMSSGIYFYRIQAGSFIDTKKMILLK